MTAKRRYYIRAKGSGWGLCDTRLGTFPTFARIDYFTMRDHGGWVEAMNAAQARCDELNATEEES